MAKKKSKNSDAHNGTNGTAAVNGNGVSTSGFRAGKSTESISNLTRPQLYSIYDEDVTRSQDSNAYEELRRSRGSQLDDNEDTLNFIPRSNKANSRSFYAKVIHFVFALFVLSISGIAYHEVSRHLHDNHLLHPDFASRPLIFGVQVSKLLTGGMLPDWATYAMEGVLFGLAIPLMDFLFNIKSTRNSWFSVLKCANAMLGVTFGIRKIEWNSSLQAGGAWGLLNIIIWLFFDGTSSMFLGCSSLGLITCATCYRDVTDKSQLLYFMDFYFLGLLFFGKVGRYLFS
ncbi:hypothetical protein HG535_0G00570 [Zygotorulaspora mrakii]|uniref:Protein NSG2 n=1 Tax=Zygotorulaspora mrakii TaxID=42260 RepID=A0A7H9B6P6_ZYGMR|nr:uncharacterized protein HG535_0G00570 [Zygotorulaspora mrakii]QLG74173.1 hypothetical protein HG535_0G00570 [Zygotorulaspora mrakii]